MLVQWGVHILQSQTSFICILPCTLVFGSSNCGFALGQAYHLRVLRVSFWVSMLLPCCWSLLLSRDICTPLLLLDPWQMDLWQDRLGYTLPLVRVNHKSTLGDSTAWVSAFVHLSCILFMLLSLSQCRCILIFLLYKSCFTRGVDRVVDSRLATVPKLDVVSLLHLCSYHNPSIIFCLILRLLFYVWLF